MYALEIKNLSKQIDGRQILSNVNFSISEGEIMALIGPNGAGKTTTLKCIMNAVQKDTGEIFIFGKPFNPLLKTNIAFVSEHRKVFANLSLEDYYKMYKALYPCWDDNFFKNIISRYEFNLNQEMQKFSEGQRTLLLSILAFSTNAKLIILDEPTQHLDPAVRFELIDIIKQYVNENKATVLLSSHEIYELEEYASSFAIIKDGRILYTDSIDEAKQKHRILSLNKNVKGAKVIAVINDEVLVKTDEDIGEYPRLNQIIVGYLKSTEENF
ncbi:ABC transporter ATP-binding protein [Thermoanaerobacterium thermosaccharolyticum]|uniref:ABC transporter ATP-binding protein n=1 Tax=Thermoanaerobacterium thermosaccharolyticum TaxID=1517 RepID=UPI003DA95C24